MAICCVVRNVWCALLGQPGPLPCGVELGPLKKSEESLETCRHADLQTCRLPFPPRLRLEGDCVQCATTTCPRVALVGARNRGVFRARQRDITRSRLPFTLETGSDRRHDAAAYASCSSHLRANKHNTTRHRRSLRALEGDGRYGGK